MMQRMSSPAVRYRNHGNPVGRSFQEANYKPESRPLPSRYANTTPPRTYDDEDSLITGSGLDTSFELMSATQLREQLRREQQKRRDKEREVDTLKRSTNSLMGRQARHSPTGKMQDSPINGHDSDSGISHTLSNSQGQPKTSPRPLHSSPLLHVDVDASPSRHSARTPAPRSTEEPWGLTGASGALKSLQDGMYESEQRRLTLVEKLREAHETLQRQTERLCESEAKLNDSHYTIENLSTTNEDLNKQIASLQREKDRTVEGRQEIIRQNEKLQQRVDELYQELKMTKFSQESLQAEQRKRDQVVEQTSKALDMMEEENKNFQQMKESMIKETKALRESLQMARAKAEKLELDNKELDKIAEKHELLAAHNAELNSQLVEERRANTDLDQQVDLLRAELMKAREEREVFQNRATQLEDKCADLNAKCVSSSASKERLLQEKLDLQQLLNLATHEKEQMNKTRQTLEGKLTELQLEVTQSKLLVEKKEEEMDKMADELNAVKKVGEVLSLELAAARTSLEKVQEDIKQLSADKRAVQQQQTYWENEAKRLASEKDALDKALEQHKQEFKREREQLEEQHQMIKENMKEIRQEKSKVASKCQELETMLQRANEDLRDDSLQHQEELEEWKASSDRLTASLSRKDSEIMALAEKLEEAQEKHVQLKSELQAARIKQEQYAEYRDEADRLREENKQLTQDHAEDQQVIHLLEMQKNILSKGQSPGGQRMTGEQLQAQVDHLRAELGLAEDKVNELREELARERAQASLALDMPDSVTRRSARSTPVPCHNCQELADQIVKLQELNSLLSERIHRIENDSHQTSARSKTVSELQDKCRHLEEKSQALEEGNRQLSTKVSQLESERRNLQSQAMDSVSKVEYDQLERERTRLKLDCERLKSDYHELEGRHQRFVTDHLSRTLDSTGLGASLTAQDYRDQLEAEIRKLQAENDALKRQIDHLNSQALLADNAKKRSDDKIRILEKEAHEMQAELTKQKRRQSPIPDSESALRSQLVERSHTINQLQAEMAAKNVALETMRQGLDARVDGKNQEIGELMREKEELNETRRRLEQEKLVLEIKVDEQRSVIDQLREEKPRILEDKDTKIAELHAEFIQADRNAKKLENDLRNMQEKLLEKDSELVYLRLQQTTELESAQEDTLKQVKELQGLILKKENELGDLRQELQAKSRDFRELLQAKTRQDLELEQIRDEHAHRVEQLSSANKRQEEEIIALREELNALREQLRRLRDCQEADTENLKERLSEAARETARLKEGREREVTDLQDELMRKESEIQRLLSQKGSEVAGLEEQLMDTSRELSRYKDSKEKEVTDLRNELARRESELTKQIEKKEGIIMALEEELEDEKHRKPRLMKQSMNAVEEELASVKGDLQRVNGMIDIKQSQIDEQNSRLKDLESKREELQRDKAEMRRKLEAELDENMDTIRDLNRKMDQQKTEVELLREKCKALEGQQGDRDEYSKRLESKIQGQEEELHALNRLVTDLQNRNKKLEQTRDTLQESVETYRGRNKKLEEAEKLQKKEMETLKETAGAQCTKCKRLEAQYEEVLGEKESLEEENEELHQEVENLEGLLNIQQHDAKKSQQKPKEAAKKSPVKEEIPVTQQTPKESKRPGSGSGSPSPRGASPVPKKVANPLELAAALKRLSNKTAADAAAKRTSADTSPDSRKGSQDGPSFEASGASIRGLPEAGRYDQNRRASLNAMEARLQALKSSSQVKPVKGILEKKEPGASGDQPKKQARFVLPSSRKFDKPLVVGTKDDSPSDVAHPV
ncbi:myosin-11-like isoform X2 [Acanthaster planci]|uniref:Myosin-11-like isoform X2 n=1 Tax=Acanthaster planci TaxID=133434 RepID=A0A8B7ZZ09_ACAPL|nr:myosin-11-like isoform X2 [Acanthaster planci]